MTVYEAVLARRSIRRFQPEPVPFDLLEKCVNAARLAPSAGNHQRLEYIVVDEGPLVDKVFASVRWAAYLKPSWTPPPDRRPTAYIVMVADRAVKGNLAVDVGLAAENILLTAVEAGLGACCLGSAKKAYVMDILGIPEGRHVALVIALGYPAESPELTDASGSIQYWRDEHGVLHVPKKRLAMIMHRGKFSKDG